MKRFIMNGDIDSPCVKNHSTPFFEALQFLKIFLNDPDLLHLATGDISHLAFRFILTTIATNKPPRVSNEQA